MQLRKAIVLLAVFIFAASSAILLANAQPPEDQEGSLPSGYLVTSDWHGINTPLGADVHVTAYTTNASVKYVTFIWRNAAEEIVFGPDVVNTYSIDNTLYTEPVYVFEAPVHAPDSMGEWGVQAIFQGPTGQTVGNFECKIAIRATSFNVIPEIPLLGTAGASIAMVVGLAFKLKRKNPIVK